MSDRRISPVGTSVAQEQRRRARQSARYRGELERLAPYERIARAVIRLRLDHDLSQAQLGDKTGTTASAIARLESGRHRPNVETLRKLARAYGGHLVIGFEIPGRARLRARREVVSV